MKVLIASSSRSPWFESQDPAEHNAALFTHLLCVLHLRGIDF